MTAIAIPAGVSLSAAPSALSPNEKISSSTKEWKDQRVYSSTFPALLRFFHHPVSFATARPPDF
ncbi:hypothetical protein GCM10010336_27390 [Streptomyces goshikiensis]|nr:hypothetical protein GCM10010336_27390 [Streptomyces goshikiensis]